MLKNDLYYKSQLQKVLVKGGLLRFIFLFIVVVIFNDSISPYIMSDDIAYEKLANTYLSKSSSVFDLRVISLIGVDNYLEVFWPYVMCISAKLFQTEYAGRIINCLLSTYCIFLVYNLTLLVSGIKETALKAAKLFAYLPYPWIICCFPLKDIFLTTVVLVVFTIFVKIQNGIKIPVGHLVITLFLLIATSFTRGAVVEFLGLVGSLFVVKSLIDRKKTHYAILVGLLGITVLFNIWNDIMESFQTKIEDYNTEEYKSIGLMRHIQINSLTDLWKLPATYFFAMIQPMTQSIFKTDWSNWSYFLRILNISMYPIAFGNLIYAFTKKYNKLFWYTSFLMYASVFSLSLGIYRHYLFLFPFLVINYACNQSINTKNYSNKIITAGTFFMILVVVFLSL